MKRYFVLAAASLAALHLHGAILYSVTLDTSSLSTSSAAPFYLSFQLADGSGTGDGNNAATITDFAFGAGAPSGASITIGDAFGDLSSSAVMTDASGISFFAQSFTPGQTLQFDLSLTTNLDPGPIADSFTISILDGNLLAIPTTAGAPFDMVAEIDIDSDNPTVTVFTADTSRTPSAGGGPIPFAAPAITPAGIPEPEELGPVVLILCMAGARRRLRVSP